MESIFRDTLEASQLFDTVEVDHTDDPDQLVVGLCAYRAHLDEDHVASALERLWDDQVRHPFWEAHTTYVDDGYVELETATRLGPAGNYVTFHLVAQRSPVPGQRLRPV
ncbi:MAG TPA: hypothetical protein VFZ64_14410 [Nocardioidaceae bacterium]